MRRPIARPEPPENDAPNPALGAASRRFSSSNDSARLRRFPYVTASRLRWLSGQLSKQDWRTLEFVAACRLSNGRQIVQHLWGTADRESATARAGRRTLKRLVDWRVLEPLPRRVGNRAAGSESTVYYVGRAGTRLLAQRGYRVRTGTPGALYVEHTLACTQVVVDLDAAHGAGTLELVAPPEPEPRCWRRFVGSSGGFITLKPDLFARIAAGAEGQQEDRWFLEIDRSTESSATLKRKALVHLAYWRSGTEEIHPRVLWVVPDERRVVQLCEVLARLPKEVHPLFSVCLHDEVIQFLAREAQS